MFTHYGQRIELNAMLFEKCNRRHHFIVSTFTGTINTVLIMEMCWPINGDANQKMLLGKETCPLFINEHTVGLQRVFYLLAPGILVT